MFISLKSKFRAYINSFSNGLINAILTFALWAYTTSSKNSFYILGSDSPIAMLMSWAIEVMMFRVFEIKSTKAWALIVVRSLYSRLNSLNSIAYFTNLLDMSCWCRICHNSGLVNTITLWAKKYGCIFLIVVTKASAHFLCMLYRVSGSNNTLLT